MFSNHHELRDPSGIQIWWFRVIVLNNLNKLNLDPQGKFKMRPDLLQSVFIFISKVKLTDFPSF